MVINELFGFFWQNGGGKLSKGVIKHRNNFSLTYCSVCAAKKHIYILEISHVFVYLCTEKVEEGV